MSKKNDFLSKYSKEELGHLIDIGRKLAAKSVHYAIADLIRENASHHEQLAKQVEEAAPYNYCGYTQLEFDNIPYKLNICLSKVPRDYKATIEIPNEKYVQEIFREYETLKFAALTYFGSIIDTPLLQTVYIALGNKLDLTVDVDNPTTLYFDNLSKSRIGIFPYYVNELGQPLIRTPEDI